MAEQIKNQTQQNRFHVIYQNIYDIIHRTRKYKYTVHKEPQNRQSKLEQTNKNNENNKIKAGGIIIPGLKMYSQ